MAITKAWLIELGVESAMASAILSEHGKMQTSYLKQIDELNEQVSESAKKAESEVQSLSEKLKAEQEKTAKLDGDYKAELGRLKFESKSAGILAAKKPHDPALVLSLIDISDLDADAEDFETKFTERLDKVAKDKPFLFPAVEEDKSKKDDAEDDSDDKGGAEPPKVQGFVPAKSTGVGETKQTTSYTRVGQEMLPNISDIMNLE